MSAALRPAVLCRHFGSCGGCAYQDMAVETYRAFKRDHVAQALARQGLSDAEIGETVEIGPGTRRRAAFKVAKRDGVVSLGFHAASSHEIVDMQECLLLAPGLWALVPRLRAMMGALLHDTEKAELFVTDTENGVDVSIHWKRKLNPALFAEVARHAVALKLARVTANGETLAKLAQPVVTFGKARVALPPNSFLQPTLQGEAALQAQVTAIAKGCKSVADLFAGCGTFALVVAQAARVHAVELDRPAQDALTAAARATQGLKPITTEARDLFKRPLSAPELVRFDAVVLDPPRVGAAAQAKELARSKVARVAYVSCNPESFARDARILCEGGYRMGPITPVDQFLWSSHIELVTAFQRE